MALLSWSFYVAYNKKAGTLIRLLRHTITRTNRIDANKIPDRLSPACHQLWGPAIVQIAFWSAFDFILRRPIPDGHHPIASVFRMGDADHPLRPCLSGKPRSLSKQFFPRRKSASKHRVGHPPLLDLFRTTFGSRCSGRFCDTLGSRASPTGVALVLDLFTAFCACPHNS